MTALTPEAARAAAEWLDKRSVFSIAAQEQLRAEADRLEAAARTPGQVLATSMACDYSVKPRWWDDHAAAVIAHHVGPDRVVVERSDVAYVTGGASDPAQRGGAEARLREALS